MSGWQKNEKLPQRIALREKDNAARRRLKAQKSLKPGKKDAPERHDAGSGALRSPLGMLDGSPLRGIDKSTALSLSHKRKHKRL